MPPDRTSNLDQNVSPNWRPVAGLTERKPGMTFSDRLWYWLVSLGGLAIIAVGVAVLVYLHMKHTGGWLIGVGFVVFILGSPSQAARNGYRSSYPVAAFGHGGTTICCCGPTRIAAVCCCR